MRFRSICLIIFFLLFNKAFLHAESPYTYQVEFCGLNDKATSLLLQRESKLFSLIDQPPLTAAGLQNRVDDEIKILLRVLQSKAYYNPIIKPEVDWNSSPIFIYLAIETGSVYSFSSFEVIGGENTKTCCSISIEDLEINIGKPAYPAAIFVAEERLLSILEKRGYPLAKIEKREILADVAQATIAVTLFLNSGPQAFFGETEIEGNHSLLPIFFCRKIAWNVGDLYNPEKIQRTLNALELSGLFSSISLTHADSINEEGYLPMHLVIDEAKHRSVGFGIGYATDLGFGVNGEWENRNISGKGDKLSFVSNLWQIKQEGFVRYVQPDFLRPRQDLILVAEAEHEDVKAFREASFSFSGTLERQINDRLRISGGAMFTKLRNTHSDNNRTFSLIKTPLQWVWNGADRMMDPTSGLTMHIKTTPTFQTQAPCFSYSTHWLSATAYQPIDSERRFVLAAKATFGSIWGATKHSIPPSERFYAGSDTLLRGYHYLTVCPLNEFNKPIGGRSLMAYSLEIRMRIKDPFGLVLFYDIGNVYSQSLPQFGHKQLQSAGVGLRYHTPVGPIRLDIAFPFNPRKHLDAGCQVYFSIGQSF